MEALERRRLVGLLILLCIFCNSIEGQRNNTKMSYVCPPNFIRLGHSCYFFSEQKADWKKALFECKDRANSSLSVPARWEDRNLRKYLNKPNITKESRWIGGIYDQGAKAWLWGGELRRMHYQSFSKMKPMSEDNHTYLQCIAMIPDLLYRWAPRSCIESNHYICQTKLQKVTKTKVKELRRRWERMGKLNEIIVPSVSRENDAMVNDVTSNPILNPKSFDLQGTSQRAKKGHGPNVIRGKQRNNVRPNELRKRSRLRTGGSVGSRLTRPFPGYTWNRNDPEGSYDRNAELLRSGRTGLSAQKVKTHLARLQHMRDRQLRRRRLRNRDDWLVNEPKPALSHTHARTYTIDNNISALHPKTIVEEFDIFPQPIAVRSTRGTG